MKLPGKQLKTDPKLLALLKASAAAVALMTPEERKKMYEAQAASWCRQDMD